MRLQWLDWKYCLLFTFLLYTFANGLIARCVWKQYMFMHVYGAMFMCMSVPEKCMTNVTKMYWQMLQKWECLQRIILKFRFWLFLHKFSPIFTENMKIWFVIRDRNKLIFQRESICWCMGRPSRNTIMTQRKKHNCLDDEWVHFQWNIRFRKLRLILWQSGLSCSLKCWCPNYSCSTSITKSANK